MKTSQPGRDDSEKPPAPSVSATRKAITDRIIREAIACYHDAVRSCREHLVDGERDPALDNVREVVSDRFVHAERTLVRAILAPIRADGVCAPEKRLFPTRGVRYAGRLYLVSPDDDDSCNIEGGEQDVMRLTVVDLDKVGGMDDAPILDLDKVGGMDDAPAPRRVAVRDPREEVPRPLLRQTMTIVPPWDNGSAATLEVIVLADGTHLDDVTAGRFDVGELGEAGWIANSIKGLQVFLRVLG